ncbi:hypothetical protein CALCODRAFT_487688 [Calocera cornea HHB12733]|uniref:Uncharacterized protein n=1 Tax=Calocera cornea HHB12733 TaxID=1353952 RepID=A0A165CZ24_9BASI|nr:hypothetical protein CALCODRAFT_487688 [Calocera cornea HHB12733]
MTVIGDPFVDAVVQAYHKADAVKLASGTDDTKSTSRKLKKAEKKFHPPTLQEKIKT